MDGLDPVPGATQIRIAEPGDESAVRACVQAAYGTTSIVWRQSLGGSYPRRGFTETRRGVEAGYRRVYFSRSVSPSSWRF